MSFRERANRIIPGGAHTYSKGHDQFPANVPQAFVRGKGARVWDLDGREFVDWGMGINNVLIGHAEDAIDDAAVAAARRGQNFSRPTVLEIEAAEELVGLFDGMEMAKFAKNGSDANTSAIRLARAVTGRPLVFYDGAAPFLAIHDWFIGNTPMRAGVPQAVSGLAKPFIYNDVDSVDRLFAEHGRDAAAVILEPCRENRPAPGFLERLRMQCDRHGAVLIYDEVVTGFRLTLHGTSRLFGVTPDLMSVGKGLANGYALTALLGRRALMDRGGLGHREERVFLLSTTNGAEQSALAAGRATIAFYQQHDVIDHLARVGDEIRSALASVTRPLGIDRFLAISGDFAARAVLVCLDHTGAPSAPHRTLFHQEMIRHGIFMPWICPSFRHRAEEIERTAAAFARAADTYARAIEAGSVEGLLEGPAARPVFRRFN
jgi:glutamate-1-semialdehyde 2,1-aminomutase